VKAITVIGVSNAVSITHGKVCAVIGVVFVTDFLEEQTAKNCSYCCTVNEDTVKVQRFQ